jgi:hypothetical protein
MAQAYSKCSYTVVIITIANDIIILIFWQFDCNGCILEINIKQRNVTKIHLSHHNLLKQGYFA